ncbi:hypothetical protein F4604DRAFT_1917157 [Suillus subluteus]|nr:hypothetical protein F4604DRAFT_1917157 [Suillus subluteus]
MFQHPSSMQHHPEGAAPAEKSVSTAQGQPNNHHSGFNPSGLGLYGDGLSGGHGGGHGMYDFGGSQQNGPGLNQMYPHQFDQPSSGGHNPHMTPYGNPGSCGHSVPPAMPMMGDHPSL